MANIVVTTTGESIVVAFNDYATTIGSTKRSYSKNDLMEIELNSNHVTVLVRSANGGNKWYLTYDSSYSGNDFFIVDSISAVAPTSESDLFDKIVTLRG